MYNIIRNALRVEKKSEVTKIMAKKQKKLQELNLEDDFLFAKVMSDKDICKRVIEKVLDIKIKEIKMPEEQKVIDLLLDSKSVRLDVYVNDEKGTVYNVEMQQGKNINLAKRSRYYQGNIDLDKISKGDDYSTLNKSYVIFICTFDPFGKGRHRYTFRNLCVEDNSIELKDETDKVFLNTSGILNDVDEEMIEFLQYVEQSTDEVAQNAKSDLVKAINQKVNHVKHDKAMEVQYMTLLERDRLNFEEGVEEGIEKGKVEATEQSAKALMDILDDETISKKLKLPIERVKELRREVNEPIIQQ